MKILFASSKEMNTELLVKQPNDINFSEVYDNISFIKSIQPNECMAIFKTKNDIYGINQNINIESKQAIELFNGISFRQLDYSDLDKFSDVYILSALYGLSKADDMISPFRYDYSMKYSKTNRKAIYNQVNSLLEKEEIVYNLSSKEFSDGIKHHNLVNFTFYLEKNGQLKQQSVASKKNRGAMLMHIVNGNNIEDYNFEGFTYNHELSNITEYVFVKYM